MAKQKYAKWQIKNTPNGKFTQKYLDVSTIYRIFATENSEVKL